MFFFEQILKRLSLSKYKESIILKGGLFLSSIIGEDLRATRDMDVSIKGFDLNEKEVFLVFNEILSIDLNDNIDFKIIDVKDIREEDEYGGFKLNIESHLDNLKIFLWIEITTGDVITPKEIEYKYNSIFNNEKIDILTYSIETVIAEKYETVIKRGLANTRMKDFYDLYMLNKNNQNLINYETLKTAIENTFIHRNTVLNVNEIETVLNDIKNSSIMKKRWLNYKSNNIFVDNINYSELFNCLFEITNLLKKEFID